MKVSVRPTQNLPHSVRDYDAHNWQLQYDLLCAPVDCNGSCNTLDIRRCVLSLARLLERRQTCTHNTPVKESVAASPSSTPSPDVTVPEPSSSVGELEGVGAVGVMSRSSSLMMRVHLARSGHTCMCMTAMHRLRCVYSER